MYDLIITNVDLLANSCNKEAVFAEYLWNIPRMSVSKIFQGHPRKEYCEVMKIFLEFKKLKKLFCGISCESFNIDSLLQFFSELVQTVLHLE